MTTTRKRRSQAETRAIAQRVVELAARQPTLTHEELGAELGLQRSYVTYLLQHAHRLALRAGRTELRHKPGRKRRRRNDFYVAMRCTAVRAVRAAFPHMKPAEIAEALDFDRAMVTYYLLGHVKSELHARPAWADRLLEACRLLSEQPGRAAEKFEALARELYRLNQT